MGTGAVVRRRCAGVAAFVGLLVTGACAPTVPADLAPSAPPADLRVMTYNVLGAQGDENVFSEWAGWAARVRQLRPDVLVLQEAQSGDVGAVVTGTGDAYRVASYGWWPCDAKGDPEGVAILVRTVLDVSGAGVRFLGSTCQDPTMQRVLAWADVVVDDAPVRVYGTHLTAGGGAAAASRDAQVRQLRSIIAGDDPTGSRRWVVAGDLNLTPSSALYRTLVEAADPLPYDLVDAYAEVSPPAGDRLACPTFGDDPTAQATLLPDPARVRACGYSAGWPKDDALLACDVLSWCTSWERRRDLSVRERIDMVLVPSGGSLGVVGAWVPNRSDPDWASPGAEWFRLSDHLPVVVDLTIG